MFSKAKQKSKDILRRLLLSRGYIIHNSKNYRARMVSAVEGLKNRKHSFNSIIDVGASDGRWSSLTMQYFPDCNYLLVEANTIHQENLDRFSQSNPNSQYVIAAAGDTIGHIEFDASDPFVGQASHNFSKENTVTIPMTTIDHEVATRELKGPFLIKLDTHGFELPILGGAEQVLAETDAIIVECYNFRLSSESLMFYEMCEYLKQFGFRCIDLVDPRHRPYDGVLWQMDLVFVKETSHEFTYTDYY